MAKGCCGASCACRLEDAGHVTITGTGTQQDPFVITGDVALSVSDTTNLDLSLAGSGTVADPWVLSGDFATGSKLDALGDVNAPAPTNGQVLSWDAGSGKWVAVNPTTASAGSVNHDTSLTGDGSVGSPLGVAFDPDRLVDDLGSGVGLTDDAIKQLVRSYADDAARSADPIAPDLNSLSVLDSEPGIVYFWDGTQWAELDQVSANVNIGGELLNLSGAYDGRPITLLTKQASFTTDVNGTAIVLDTPDIGTFAGVLSVSVQETGGVPYKALVNVDDTAGTVLVTCYRLDTGDPYASVALTATVQAQVY